MPEPLTGPAIVAMGVLWTVLGVALLAAALSMQDFASLYAPFCVRQATLGHLQPSALMRAGDRI